MGSVSSGLIQEEAAKLEQAKEQMIRYTWILCIVIAVVVVNVANSHPAAPLSEPPSTRTNVNPEKPMDPKESAKQQKLKKELGEKMSVLDSMDKKGNDDDFVPWAMGWISSATGMGAGATR